MENIVNFFLALKVMKLRGTVKNKIIQVWWKDKPSIKQKVKEPYKTRLAKYYD